MNILMVLLDAVDAAHHDNRRPLILLHFPDHVTDVISHEFWKENVEKDEIGPLLPECFNTLQPISGHEDGISLGGEILIQQLGNIDVIFNDQNLQLRHV